MESLKPSAVAAKEEKPVEDAPKTEEAVKAEEASKEREAIKEEIKDDEPKRRSASRKRASFFNFGGKKEDKKDERKSEDALASEPATAAAVETEEAPLSDTPAVADEKPAEEAVSAESPKEKPAPSKRNSFFGNVFSKKEKKPFESSKTADETPMTAAETDVTTTDAAAPVIPPVESTTPLAVDVSNPSTVPTETVETTPATGEVKKDTKEKRKSSLPFAFGKRDKSPVPVENEEKSGKSAFSKLRATIKGKSTKVEEKPVDEAVKDETAAAEPLKEVPTADGAVKEVSPAREPTAAQSEAENKPENVAASTPAVTAAA